MDYSQCNDQSLMLRRVDEIEAKRKPFRKELAERDAIIDRLGELAKKDLKEQDDDSNSGK